MTKCWIITEGLKGTENPCIALAQAAGLVPDVKTVKLKQPWKSITPWIDHFTPKALTPGSSELKAPWPDILIAGGRKAISPALWIKKQSGGKTKLVIMFSPVVKNKNFDLVVAPQHDRYRGHNVLETTGALSLVTKETLAKAKEEWRSAFEKLPGRRIAVLIGGNSRTHKFTKEVAKKLTEQLKNLVTQGDSLMITASRRTPVELQQKMRDQLKHENVFFWDGEGANPYQGLLAWADAILTTEDSVSMASEAVSTGQPTYLLKLEGGSPRFDRFHDYLIDKGYARRFEGIVEKFTYLPPNDLEQAARKVKNLLG